MIQGVISLRFILPLKAKNPCFSSLRTNCASPYKNLKLIETRNIL